MLPQHDADRIGETCERERWEATAFRCSFRLFNGGEKHALLFVHVEFEFILHQEKYLRQRSERRGVPLPVSCKD
jgi:hypothetical protein